jgi:TonB-dependent SusC/RagA subfamily outer membrane receptor
MKILLTLSSLLFTLSVAAQNDSKNGPIVLVNGFQTEMPALILNKNKIKSMDVLKDTAATKRYGRRGQFGVVVIKTEPVNFVRVNALMNRFRVADSLKKLPVVINEVPVKNTAMILADETHVVDIKPFMMNGVLMMNIRTKKE